MEEGRDSRRRMRMVSAVLMEAFLLPEKPAERPNRLAVRTISELRRCARHHARPPVRHGPHSLSTSTSARFVVILGLALAIFPCPKTTSEASNNRVEGSEKRPLRLAAGDFHLPHGAEYGKHTSEGSKANAAGVGGQRGGRRGNEEEGMRRQEGLRARKPDSLSQWIGESKGKEGADEVPEFRQYASSREFARNAPHVLRLEHRLGRTAIQKQPGDSKAAAQRPNSVNHHAKEPRGRLNKDRRGDEEGTNKAGYLDSLGLRGSDSALGSNTLNLDAFTAARLLLERDRRRLFGGVPEDFESSTRDQGSALRRVTYSNDGQREGEEGKGDGMVVMEPQYASVVHAGESRPGAGAGAAGAAGAADVAASGTPPLWRMSARRVLEGGPAAAAAAAAEVSQSPLMGTTYPGGIYYTMLGIGTPPQMFNLDIDTGSNLLWVNCVPCSPCTTSQTLDMGPPYNPANSSTSRPITCHADACVNADSSVRTISCPAAAAASTTKKCSYSATYGDGSSTSGTLVQDVLHLPLVSGQPDALIPMTIGCGNTQQGNFYNGVGWTYYQALDGLMGLGKGKFSLITAITANRNRSGGTPNLSSMLTHCLGGDEGGGWMTIGDVPLPPQMVFVHTQPHETFFRVRLVRVMVGGQQLSVNPHAYGNVTFGNAIFDSATTYTVLPSVFVRRMLNLMQRAVGLPRYTYSQTNQDSLCFAAKENLTRSEIRQWFPSINLQFDGRGVFMNIAPTTFTFFAEDGDTQLVCTQMQSIDSISQTHGISFVIGEVWMRDYLVAYDEAGKRMGWTPMKC